jgi:hypothetical protein
MHDKRGILPAECVLHEKRLRRSAAQRFTQLDVVG